MRTLATACSYAAILACLVGCQRGAPEPEREPSEPARVDAPSEAPPSPPEPEPPSAPKPEPEPAPEPESPSIVGPPLPAFARARLEHPGPVRDVEWSLDGSRIATACDDGEIRLWDANTHARVQTLTTSPGPDRHVGLSRDASVVVANAEDQVFVFDGPSGALRQTLDHGVRTSAVAVSPNGDRVISGGIGGVTIWSASGEMLHQIEKHENPGRTTGLRFGADGERFAWAHDSGQIQIYEVEGAWLVKTIEAGIASDSFAYAASGSLVAARTDVERFAFFDVATGAPSTTATVDLPHPLAFGVGDQLLLATGALEAGDFAVHIIDVGVAASAQHYLGHAAGITDAAFSPDGDTFVTSSLDTTALVWSAP